MSPRRRRLPALALLAALAALTGCADDWPGTQITVRASADSCELSRHAAEGPLTFAVINVGDDVTAVSLVDARGQVVAGLDSIDAAMTMTMAANVYDGEFEVLCQPSGGEGIRTALTVG